MIMRKESKENTAFCSMNFYLMYRKKIRLELLINTNYQRQVFESQIQLLVTQL